MIEVIIFYILLVDSVAANVLAWTKGRKWYHRHFRIISRWLPMARGWALYYLVLVLAFGFYLITQGVALW